MLTLKEIKAMHEGQYVDIELYTAKFIGETHHNFHTDYIKAYNDAEEYITEEQLDKLLIEDYELMDEYDYNNSICANSSVSADFGEWYDDADAKVLVCLVARDN